MRSRYDCVVVGGGPGGAWAAKHAAEKGARVLLLEKDREIGVPVRCAEAVGIQGLNAVVELRERWISNVIKGAILVSPSGREVLVASDHDEGYVLDRKIFDYDLVQMATMAGVDVLTKAYVHGLEKPNGVVQGVKVQHLGKKFDIPTHLVIGADGLESRVGRWAGLKTHIKLRDMESCLQMTLSNINVDPRYIYLYFGKDIAPGGYLWVFPKNEHVANVGLGISGDFARHKSAQRYLQGFIARKFPDAAVLYTVVGGVPCAPTLKQIVAHGLMLVGDAAHQVNPMTGGGIVTAMLAGKMAGQVAAEAIELDDFSEGRLSKYSKKWHESEGKNHARLHKLKQAVYKLSDMDLNKTADKILHLAPEKRTITNILKTALLKNPSLVLEAFKLFVK